MALLNEQTVIDEFLPLSFPESLRSLGSLQPSTPRYHIMTWGCQMNEEDSEQMALTLEGVGYQHTSTVDDADVILLNTCSVRRKPEEKVYSMLGRLRELKLVRPETVIGVCGCMAQVESDEIRRRAPFVEMVVGTGNIAAIPEMLRGVQSRREKQPGAVKRVAQTALSLPPRKGAVVTDVPIRQILRKPKLKAHVPIMYGCDKFCTFCIVPLTRGRERSRPSDEIIHEVEMLARAGTREVTLLGQTVNSYGKNLAEGRVPFARLLERLSAIPGLRRIRFTSPYPKDFTDDLIETIAKLPKVCKHVHLPLQVGDDELLARMHRGYTLERYREIVAKLRLEIPHIAITTDLMLGFPGETDEQFQNTMTVVDEIQFDSAFMFAYSPRPGTKASDMEEQVPHAVKIERLSALIELQNGITIEKNRSMVGTVIDVLVEGRSERDPNRLSGNTEGLKMVNFTVSEGGTRSPESLIGKIVPVELMNANLIGFTGEYREPDPKDA